MGKYYRKPSHLKRARVAAAITISVIAVMLGFDIYLMYFNPSPITLSDSDRINGSERTPRVVYKLITPPIVRGSAGERVDIEAPLSEWNVVESFDSEKACDQKRLTLVMYGAGGVNGPSAYSTRESAALCILAKADAQ